MIFETVSSDGLAHLSYLIGDQDAGACAVIDPRRDVDVYLELARRHRVRIERILETHIHADFVSGSRELQARTGAPIHGGASDHYHFEITPLEEDDRIDVGNLELRVLHTPGHSPEHVCFVVSGGGTGADEEWGVFTGDTLFAGEVGRPDLGEEGGEQQARELYRSLHDRLLELDDGVVVYPAHGEGSPCGGDIGARSLTTLGYERRHEEKLSLDEDEFVERLMASLGPPPRYYGYLKELNGRGPEVLGAWPTVPALGVEEFEREAKADDTLIVDVREIVAFGGAHVAGSLNIALRPAFPVWVGHLLDPGARIVLVADRTDDVELAQRHLLRIGYDRVVGSLAGGFRAWSEAGQPFEQRGITSVHALHDRLPDDELQLLDVRSDGEWEGGHLPGAEHVYLPRLPEQLDRLDRDRPTVVYCGSGFRSAIAASLLRRAGFSEVSNVNGAVKAWTAAGYELTQGP